MEKIHLFPLMKQEERVPLANLDDLPPAHLTLRSLYDYGDKRDLS
jgi:hypothetical protein